MRPMLLAIAFLAASPAAAQDVSGTARAADGDSLGFGGIAVRLYGIDAPELAQSCERSGATWACGKEAAARLANLVAGRQVICVQKDIDDYGRSVAACRAGEVDLAGAMIDVGLAVALPHFTDHYAAAEARARDARRGLWAGSFQMPADFRAAHARPPERRRDLPQSGRDAPRARPTAPSGVYFRNCREAWAAGAAPLRRGAPGYRLEMDGDGDGIACEPYRQR